MPAAGPPAPVDQVIFPSSLRPPCPAKDRLLRWRPFGADGRNRDDTLSAADILRIREVTAQAWAPSTAATYGSGLLAFHTFCDHRNLPDAERTPISRAILNLFLATLAGSYAGSSIVNYYAAVRAWHVIHGVDWIINDLEVKALLKGAERLAPPSTHREREPYMLAWLAAVFNNLNPAVPLDASVRFCGSALLFGIARCGELTVPRQDAFDPTKHITPCDVRMDQNREGEEVTVLHPPSTKANPISGEDIMFAAQSGPVNPVFERHNHMAVNHPAPLEHLFTYSVGARRVPLSRAVFLRRLGEAAIAAKVPKPTGHSFRIGGTLEYLLRGVPFESVKAMGRWRSESFLVYLRRHAQTLASFFQDHPGLQAELINRTLSREPAVAAAV